MRCSRDGPDRGTAALAARAAAPCLLRGRPLFLQPTCAPGFPFKASLLGSASAACMLLSSSVPQELFLVLMEAADDADDGSAPAAVTWLGSVSLLLLACFFGAGHRGSARKSCFSHSRRCR